MARQAAIDGQVKHLVEVAIVKRAVPADAHERPAHHALDGLGVEPLDQQFHVALGRALLLQVLQEAADGHVGERQEPVEGDAEARAEFALVFLFQGFLRRRQRWAERVINQVQHQPGSWPAVAKPIQPLERFDALGVYALAALRVHILLEIAGHGSGYFHLMIAKEFWQVTFPFHEKHSEVRPVNDVAAERARLADQVFEIGVELRRAAGDVHDGDVAAGEHRNNLLGGLARHDFGARRARVHVAVAASLVAELADIYLQGCDARSPQSPAADLDEFLLEGDHASIFQSRCAGFARVHPSGPQQAEPVAPVARFPALVIPRP